MKEIRLNNILHIDEKELDNCKVQLNLWPGSDVQKLYIDIWLNECSDRERESGITKCAYWSTYSKTQNNFKEGQIVFCFIRLHKIDEWLFISAGKILKVNKDNFADVEILEKYKPYFGRLVMKFKKKDARGRYVFNYSFLNNEEEIIEILPKMYSGEQFDGYENVSLPFKKLKDILDRRCMPSYYTALQKRKGIYCLTDTSNGKLYIGSATGDEGFAQRWNDYIKTMHGGNAQLIKLQKEKGNSYFEENFRFTIIEDFKLSYDTDKIIKREEYWKGCLDTITHGYNKN